MLHRNFVSRANAFLRGAMGATRIHARMCVMCKISDLHAAASLSPPLSLSLSLSLSLFRRVVVRAHVYVGLPAYVRDRYAIARTPTESMKIKRE